MAEVSGAAAVHIMIHFLSLVLYMTVPPPRITPLFIITGFLASLISTNPPPAGSSRCLPRAHIAISGSPPLMVEPEMCDTTSMFLAYCLRSR